MIPVFKYPAFHLLFRRTHTLVEGTKRQQGQTSLLARLFFCLFVVFCCFFFFCGFLSCLFLCFGCGWCFGWVCVVFFLVVVFFFIVLVFLGFVCFLVGFWVGCDVLWFCGFLVDSLVGVVLCVSVCGVVCCVVF